jgi:CRP/FNR family transcriptional regulator, dissimilatory nitrate respiration regulator
MEKYYQLLLKNQLFINFQLSELNQILSCITKKVTTYQKQSLIIRSGDEIKAFGIVLSGRVSIIREDYHGASHLMTTLSANGIFAETFVFAKNTLSPVSVQADELSEILWLDYYQFIHPCQHLCGFHTQLIENTMALLASKNQLLSRKIEILSQKSIREKVMTFLQFNDQQTTKHIRLNLTKKAMAEYLGIDRSALVRELSRMQHEGLIRYQKNEYWLL